jgi:hypothetical protein
MLAPCRENLPMSSFDPGWIRPVNPARGWLAVATIVWLTLIVVTYLAFLLSKRSPGESAAPLSTNLEASGTMTLRLFLHPHCPCSNASLHEFAGIVEQAGPALDATVYFVRPPGIPDGWEESATWRSARQLSGIRVTVDAEGAEARRHGARTSGHTILCDAAGSVRFQGGITRARGHAGDSIGRAAIVRVLRGHDETHETPVFGCPLFTPPQTTGGLRS